MAELQDRLSSVCTAPGLTPPRWMETKACGRLKRSALIVASTCEHRLPYYVSAYQNRKSLKVQPEAHLFCRCSGHAARERQ